MVKDVVKQYDSINGTASDLHIIQNPDGGESVMIHKVHQPDDDDIRQKFRSLTLEHEALKNAHDKTIIVVKQKDDKIDELRKMVERMEAANEAARVEAKEMSAEISISTATGLLLLE